MLCGLMAEVLYKRGESINRGCKDENVKVRFGSNVDGQDQDVVCWLDSKCQVFRRQSQRSQTDGLDSEYAVYWLVGVGNPKLELVGRIHIRRLKGRYTIWM